MGPGIGAHVAEAYGAAGANVVLAARTDRIELLATELGNPRVLRPGGPDRRRAAADLERLVAEAERAFGTIDIVFNNAHARRRARVDCRLTIYAIYAHSWVWPLQADELIAPR